MFIFLTKLKKLLKIVDRQNETNMIKDKYRKEVSCNARNKNALNHGIDKKD